MARSGHRRLRERGQGLRELLEAVRDGINGMRCISAGMECDVFF